jgi:ATP/maltotriose-dependent transcriptional regulator MalT/DNA-binding SARP family transcriptional activator
MKRAMLRPMVARRGTSKSAAMPAKISVPRLAETYERSRLFRAVDAGRKRRVVWLAAPAGAGKTSLVATYLASRKLRALWYNVDARDADVAHLFHYLALAAERASPRKKLDLPEFTSDSECGVAAFARGFFEALCRERPVPSLIVLDDYQEAAGQLWHEVIREAVSALPKGIVAVIISRTDPPAPFARLVASGEIAIVGWDELRLTTRETAGLVRLCRPDWHRSQVDEAVAGLSQLANGWAAALTLLLQSHEFGAWGGTGAEAFSERLFDYFATEILDKTTVAQRDFLLRTSVVPSLTAALAVRLTGAADAARTLTELGRRSFLTDRLGSSGAYRYHPLLRGFLRRRAERDLGAHTLHELHRRAAEYFVEANQIDEAMEQLETANDVAVRTKLLLRVAPTYFARGRGRTLEAWIARLPADAVEQEGWLIYWRAICAMGHSPAGARALFEELFRRFERGRDAALLYQCCASAMLAILHEGMDFAELDGWINRFERLEAEGPPCPDSVRPVATTGMLVAVMFGRAEPEVHRYWVDRAMEVGSQCDDLGHRVMTGAFLAIYFVFNDNPAQAATILEMLRASVRSESSAIASLALLQGDALCAWARGENDTAIAAVREALNVAARTGVYVWNDYLLGLGAASAMASDDVESSREFVTGLAEAAERGMRYSLASYHFYASWQASQQGDLPRALRSAELAYEFAAALGYLFAKSAASLAIARANWQAGHRERAQAAMLRSRALANQERCLLVLYSCDLVEADALWDDDRGAALGALRRGLALGRERGYFNAFCVGSSAMSRLSERAMDHGIEPDFVRTLIARRKLRPVTVTASASGWHWSYRLRALGPFDLERGDDANGGDRRLPSGMPLRLLQAALALGGRGVPEARLIDALWPDAEGDGGRRVFDTTLHRLRRSLGDDGLIRLTDGKLHLDEHRCWVDLWAFDEAIARVDRAIAKGAFPVGLAELAELLLGLYRGPLLCDAVGFSAFVRRSRTQLSGKFFRAAEKLGQALEIQKRFDQASALYQRAADGEDAIELAYTGLIRCAVGAGRRAEAVRLYEQCRSRMLADLGEEPGPGLASLGAALGVASAKTTPQLSRQ